MGSVPALFESVLNKFWRWRCQIDLSSSFRSELASVNGVRLHYWIGGEANGPPVLLWHGFLGTAYSWHRLMPLLVDSGFWILVPDMRGYGDSDKPAGDAGYDSAALAEEFRSLVERIGFGAGRPLTLIAHDMGVPQRCSGPQLIQPRSLHFCTLKRR